MDTLLKDFFGHTGCQITGFPAFRDTQKHCQKPNFLTGISDRKPYKNQRHRKQKFSISIRKA